MEQASTMVEIWRALPRHSDVDDSWYRYTQSWCAHLHNGTGDGQTSPSTLQRCFVFKQPFMSVGTIGDLSLEDQYRITTITTTTTATITMTPAAVD